MSTVAVPFSVHCLENVNNSLIKPTGRQSACSDVTGHVTPLLPVPMATAGEVTMYSCILCDVCIIAYNRRQGHVQTGSFLLHARYSDNPPPPPDHCLQGTKGRTLFTFYALPVVSFRRRKNGCYSYY